MSGPSHVSDPLQQVMAEFRRLARSAPTEDELTRQMEADRRATIQSLGAARAQAFAASLPVAYWHCVDDPLVPDAGNRDAVTTAAMLRPGRSLFLYGDPGVGKTHLAIHTAARLSREHGIKAHFWSWPRLVDRLRDFRNTDRMPSIAEPDILIADDLDKGGETSFVYERVYELMQRVFDGKTTIVTSNHSPGRTALRFGMGDEENATALASRFRLFDIEHVGGRDRR